MSTIMSTKIWLILNEQSFNRPTAKLKPRYSFSLLIARQTTKFIRTINRPAYTSLAISLRKKGRRKTFETSTFLTALSLLLTPSLHLTRDQLRAAITPDLTRAAGDRRTLSRAKPPLMEYYAYWLFGSGASARVRAFAAKFCRPWHWLGSAAGRCCGSDSRPAESPRRCLFSRYRRSAAVFERTAGCYRRRAFPRLRRLMQRDVPRNRILHGAGERRGDFIRQLRGTGSFAITLEFAGCSLRANFVVRRWGCMCR